MNDEMICECGHVSMYDDGNTLYLKCVGCNVVLVDCDIDFIEL